MSFHHEMADPVGADGGMRIACCKRQDKWFIDRFAAEDDAQWRCLPRRWRADGKYDRGSFEFAFTQQIILREHLPAISLAQQKTVSLRLGLECNRAVAHNRLITRQLQQQRNPLRIILQYLLSIGRRIQRHHAERDTNNRHHDQQLKQRESARQYSIR